MSQNRTGQPSIEESHAYVLIVVFAGVVFALSPLLPWTKAYGETSVSLVRIANRSTETGFIPWLIVLYGLGVAIGATRRSIGSYVIVLVTSVVMLAVTFFCVFSAEAQAYDQTGPTQFGTWVGFGALGVVALTALVTLLRL